MTEAVKIERRDGVLEITLDRPKANAIDMVTSKKMGEAFAELRDDPDLRVGILTGGGERFFSAGWDLKAASEGEDYEANYGVGGFAGFTEMHNLDKPVIVAVNGIACGGGLDIVVSADLILAVPEAEFFFPEIFAGVMTDAGAIRLPRCIPHAIAMEMLLTGRRMGAEEAAGWGLINEVVERSGLMDRAREIAATIVSAAPLAIAATKQTARVTGHHDIESAYAVLRDGGAPLYQKMLTSEDAIEGPRAFTEKRPPIWKGR